MKKKFKVAERQLFSNGNLKKGRLKMYIWVVMVTYHKDRLSNISQIGYKTYEEAKKKQQNIMGNEFERMSHYN